MKLAKGDMWDRLEEADLFCITTNAQTRGDGALVMGRGIAAQAARRIPGLQLTSGEWLKKQGLVGKRYGLALPYGDLHPRHPIGLFQVKYHWKDAADLDLIRFSVAALVKWCETWWAERGEFPDYEWPEVHLNFPGIGNGRLSREDVLPLLEPLPDCVTVWELA